MTDNESPHRRSSASDQSQPCPHAIKFMLTVARGLRHESLIDEHLFNVKLIKVLLALLALTSSAVA